MFNCDKCTTHSECQCKTLSKNFNKFLEDNDSRMQRYEEKLAQLEWALRKSSKMQTTASPQNQVPRAISRRAICITAIFVLLTIIIGVIIAVTTNIFETAVKPKSKLPLLDDEESRPNIPINSTIDDDVYNGTLRLLSYSDWGGRPSKVKLDELNLPVHRVIISHTASESCESKDVCAYRVRVIQNFHMDSFGWDDIGYNFLVGGDGLVYIGRGWNSQGAHTKGYNSDSIGISFIGTFTTMKPTENQLKAAQQLIAEGVRLQKLVPDYKLFAHRQLSGWESPGEQLFQIIKTWPHWSSQI